MGSMEDGMCPSVSTASILILVNGSPSNQVNIHKGLQQGDSLSPFLFIIAAEGQNKFLERLSKEDSLVGWSWGQMA